MRIRDFKWSTDVASPAALLLVSVWGIAGGSPQLAFVAGASFVIIGLYVLGRVERVQPDGSYKSLVSQEWYRPFGPIMVVFGMVTGAIVLSVMLALWGVAVYLAALAGAGYAVAWGLLWTILARLRR